MATTYDFSARRGDTWGGASFTVSVNGTFLDLTGASIRWAFARPRSPANAVHELTTDDGDIVIIDAANGAFTVEPYTFLYAGEYVHDIQITLADGTVKTYLSGTATITQDVTQ